MTQYWCTYCDCGLPMEEQRDAHEYSGHIVHEIEYMAPCDDRRLDHYREYGGGDT